MKAGACTHLNSTKTTSLPLKVPFVCQDCSECAHFCIGVLSTVEGDSETGKMRHRILQSNNEKSKEILKWPIGGRNMEGAHHEIHGDGN